MASLLLSSFFFLLLEYKRILQLEINKNEAGGAHLVKEANF